MGALAEMRSADAAVVFAAQWSELSSGAEPLLIRSPMASSDTAALNLWPRRKLHAGVIFLSASRFERFQPRT
jgi:hypothetical protein